MPYPVARSAFGIAKETTVNTPAAATDYIPVTTMNPDEQIATLLDQAWRSAAAKTYGAQQGIIAWAYDLGGDLYPDTAGFVVAGLLGDETCTGTGPYVHARSLLNSGNFQPSTYTFTDYNGLDASTYSGGRFSEATFSFSADGKVTWTAKAAGMSRAATSAPSTSYSSVTPMAAWRGVTTIAGGGVSTHIDGEFDIKRTVDMIPTMANTQVPYAQFAAGDFECTVKATIVLENSTVDPSDLRTKYRGGTAVVWDVAFSQAAGATGLTLHATQLWLDKVNIGRGKSYIELDIEGEGIANTTDAGTSGGMSPCKVTVTSAKAAGYYG